MKRLLLSVFFLSVTGAAVSQEWVEQNTNLPGVSRTVTKVDIVDANTVWALAFDGSSATPANLQEFTKTTDGGVNWTTGVVEVFDTELTLTNISAVSGTTAFVGAVNADNGFGGVYKTTDSGLNWENSNPTGYATDASITPSIASSYFNVVHFFDANNGLTQGDPIGTGLGEFEVYKTTDGGANWTAVSAAALPNPLSGEYGYNGGNVAAGNSFWFVTNKGRIYRTTDMGVTWNAYQTPITNFGSATASGDLSFSDNNNGMIIGAITTGAGAAAVTSYTIYRTSDGGATWSAGTPYTVPYREVSYIPGTSTLVGIGLIPNVGYTSGYSTDNGVTWTEIDSGVQRTSVTFLDGSTGWAGGFTSEDFAVGGIYKFSGTLAVNNPIVNSKFTVSPNPTSGLMQISNENASISQVAAFDILGKQVYSATFSDLNNVSVDLSGLNSGTYFVRVTDVAGANQVVKVLKN